MLLISRRSTRGLSGLWVTERINGCGSIQENVRNFEKSTELSKSVVAFIVVAQPLTNRHANASKTLTFALMLSSVAAVGSIGLARR